MSDRVALSKSPHFEPPWNRPNSSSRSTITFVRLIYSPQKHPLVSVQSGKAARERGTSSATHADRLAATPRKHSRTAFSVCPIMENSSGTVVKLTVTHPEIVDVIADCPGGLLPFRGRGDSRMIMVVKTARAMAQTARLRREFRFYLVPVHVGEFATYGLVTAFFDDNDEPLVIQTPLIDEERIQDFLLLLSSDIFYVHFFDERNRELLGFRAENPNAHRFRLFSNTVRFVPPTLERARQVLDEMQFRFSTRSPSDDTAACTVHLRERLFPDNLAEQVDNPGELNEPDIATALHRSFRGDNVFTNPIRADNGREFVDVLVQTGKTVLLIQAKDSPSTESALTRKITRKIGIAAKHVRKATRQLKGSINHLLSGDPIDIITDGKSLSVSMSGRNVFGLVIVNELFDPERSACSSPVLDVFGDTGIPCILLDHSDFQQLTFFRTSEESFVGTLREIFSAASEHGMFPRNRFGLRTGKTVVYQPGGTGNVPDSTKQEPARPFADGRHITDAQLSEDWVTGEATGMRFRRDLGADWLRVVPERPEVEALDVSRTALMLSRVLADRSAVERYRGSVDLAFFGYSNDPRELYDIPEVRLFCSKLDDAFPYWFYFLSTDRLTLGTIACCLCSVTQLRPGVVSLGPDLFEFIERHYEALNWLFDNYSLDEKHNVEISHNVAQYFSKFEPIQ